MERNSLKVNIDDYIRLYNKGCSMDSIKPLSNQTYKVFKGSKFDVRIVDRRFVYEDIRAYERIKFYIAKNEYFYMIPIMTIKETIVGFILRGVLDKEYTTISRDFNEVKNKVPLMFGFNKDFLRLDKNSKSYPLIICEGCKDCMVLQKYYPFVLSNNTSSMGLNAEVLSNISNKFLLAYDNDEAGIKGMEKDKKILRNKGFFVDTLNIKDGFKDCADCADNPEVMLDLIKQMRRKLSHLYAYK